MRAAAASARRLGVECMTTDGFGGYVIWDCLCYWRDGLVVKMALLWESVK